MKNNYKNEIFQYLLTHPLVIDNFKFNDLHRHFIVVYKPYDELFSFAFLESANSFDSFAYTSVHYVPGFKQFSSREASSFNHVNIVFQRWIDEHVQRYIDDQAVPDLWSLYNDTVNLSTTEPADYSDQSHFSIPEKDQVILGLNSIKLLIVDQFATTQQQIEIVSQSIAYLTTCVEKQNKIDFKNIFINTVITIIISLSLTHDQGVELMNKVLNIIRYVPLIGI